MAKITKSKKTATAPAPKTIPCPGCGVQMETGDEGEGERICDACALAASKAKTAAAVAAIVATREAAQAKVAADFEAELPLPAAHAIDDLEGDEDEDPDADEDDLEGVPTTTSTEGPKVRPPAHRRAERALRRAVQIVKKWGAKWAIEEVTATLGVAGEAIRYAADYLGNLPADWKAPKAPRALKGSKVKATITAGATISVSHPKLRADLDALYAGSTADLDALKVLEVKGPWVIVEIAGSKVPIKAWAVKVAKA